MPGYAGAWEALWSVGLLPVPSNPEIKKSILGQFCENWQGYYNEDTLRKWARDYPDYDVAVLLTHGFVVVSPNGEATTKIVESLHFSPHPVCYFGNGRSRHFFNNPHKRVVRNPRGIMRGMTQIKTGPAPHNRFTEDLSIIGDRFIFHVPPTLCQVTQTLFYWNPAPWEIPMPELDVRPLMNGGEKFKIIFDYDY